MATNQPPVSGRATQQDSSDASALLEALDDETCRDILNELRGTHRTAGEISEACDVPQSTTYRKLDRLTDAGLLESSVRVAPTENNPTEYTTAADGARIRLAPDGEYDVTLTTLESGTGMATPADD